jgi:Zn-dependent peptidase ImmA (M78 family)
MARMTRMEWIELQNRQENAAERAAEVLRILRIKTAPIDPLQVAASESPLLKVKGANFKDLFDGQLEYHYQRNLFLLLYNDKYDQGSDEHHARTRFSISHELGHYFLEEHHAYFVQGGKPHPSRGEFSNNTTVESEADAFAAALLMPEQIMGEMVNEGDISANLIEQWANHFRTSITSTARRSVQLSHFPCAAVGIRDGAIAGVFPSSSLIEGGCYPRVRGSSLPASAITQWNAFVSGSFRKGKAQSYASDWFQTFGSAERTDLPVFEHYLPIPVMNLLLVILTIPEDELFPDSDD